MASTTAGGNGTAARPLERRPLEGQTALVTAGGGAIGCATAAMLARDGADVLIAGRTAGTLQAAAERVAAAAAGGPGTVRWSVADALVEDDVAALVAEAAEPAGRLDIAVAVVGGSTGGSPVLDLPVASMEETLRRNVTGAFMLVKHAGRAMVGRDVAGRDGVGRPMAGGGGSIVAVSSMQAIQSAPLLAHYCGAKAGLEMFCRVAADELGAHGVRVNTVRPGLTRTGKPTHPSSNTDAQAAYLEQQPLARPGEPEDIAAAIRYLAGPESSWVTGQSITVDGGTSLRRFPDLTAFWAGADRK